MNFSAFPKCLQPSNIYKPGFQWFYSGSGIFRIPYGVTTLTLEGWGGGGGGGASGPSGDGPGAGGGSGGYFKHIVSLTVGQIVDISYIIGMAGLGGAGIGEHNGSAGTATQVSCPLPAMTLVTNGGLGGGAITGAPGTGGTTSGANTISTTGNTGGTSSGDTGGNGAAAPNGGPVATGNNGTAPAVAPAGNSPGGGGAGSGDISAADPTYNSGGMGAFGALKISW